MFPHMYKVRPGKSQRVKQADMAATDCQSQQGENWRRNSGKWGSQGWDGSNSPSASSGGPSVMHSPPPIPAPPSDPQDNLSKNTQNYLENEDNEIKEEPSVSVSLRVRNRANNSDDNSQNGNTTVNHRSRSRVRSDPKSDDENIPQEASIPNRRRVRNANEKPEEENTRQEVPVPSRRRVRNENGVSETENVPEGVQPPTRRRRSNGNEGSEESTPQEVSVAIRRRVRNENGVVSEEENARQEEPSLPIRRRTRNENGVAEEEKASQEEVSLPIRRRRRKSDENEMNNSEAEKENSSYSGHQSSPTSELDKEESDQEHHVTIPLRTTRSRQLEETTDKKEEKERTPSPKTIQNDEQNTQEEHYDEQLSSSSEKNIESNVDHFKTIDELSSTSRKNTLTYGEGKSINGEVICTNGEINELNDEDVCFNSENFENTNDCTEFCNVGTPEEHVCANEIEVETNQKDFKPKDEVSETNDGNLFIYDKNICSNDENIYTDDEDRKANKNENIWTNENVEENLDARDVDIWPKKENIERDETVERSYVDVCITKENIESDDNAEPNYLDGCTTKETIETDDNVKHRYGDACTTIENIDTDDNIEQSYLDGCTTKENIETDDNVEQSYLDVCTTKENIETNENVEPNDEDKTNSKDGETKYEDVCTSADDLATEYFWATEEDEGTNDGDVCVYDEDHGTIDGDVGPIIENAEVNNETNADSEDPPTSWWETDGNEEKDDNYENEGKIYLSVNNENEKNKISTSWWDEVEEEKCNKESKTEKNEPFNNDQSTSTYIIDDDVSKFDKPSSARNKKANNYDNEVLKRINKENNIYNEEDDEELDEITKATKMWILSHQEDPQCWNSSESPILKPEVNNCRITPPDFNFWDAEPEETNRNDSIFSNEEWNDDIIQDQSDGKGFRGVLKRHVEPNAEKAAKLAAQQKEKPLTTARARLRKRSASPPLKCHERKSSSITELIPPPPPPPPPPPRKNGQGIPPPPPPPPLSKDRPLTERDLELKVAREKVVEQIKKASRLRPDWHSVMKDIEGGIKLRKVSAEKKADRSCPILPDTRTNGGKFIYESEKPIVQNEMLNEITRGVKLRHVRTNDRSKPDFHKLGLRKFRRQMTVQEKEKIDPDAPEALPSSSDEEEDIDRMRDDLSATKTQLADEIKKTQRMEREQKILKIDIDSLQAEVRRLKRKLKDAGIHDIKPLTNGEADALGPKLSKSMSKLRMREEDLDFSELDNIEEDIKLLNDQIEAQRRRAEIAECKYEELSQKLKLADNSSDEWESRAIYFEKKYKALQKEQGVELPDINCFGTQTEPVEILVTPVEGMGGLPTKKSSSKKSFGSVFSRMESFKEESGDETSSSGEEETLSENDENEEGEENGGEDSGVRKEDDSKKEIELKMWEGKLNNLKEKEKNIIKERNNLRQRINKYYKDMRNERKEYLKVKADLQELADQMKEFGDDAFDEEESEEEYGSEDSDWSDDGSSQKPKKLRRKRKKNLNIKKEEELEEEVEEEEEEEEENLEDLSALEGPQWSESEEEEEEEEEEEYGDEEEDISIKLRKMKEKTQDFEQKMNALKKENYLLKNQIDSCEDMYAEEKRRHARLDNELQIFLAAM